MPFQDVSLSCFLPQRAKCLFNTRYTRCREAFITDYTFVRKIFCMTSNDMAMQIRRLIKSGRALITFVRLLASVNSFMAGKITFRFKFLTAVRTTHAHLRELKSDFYTCSIDQTLQHKFHKHTASACHDRNDDAFLRAATLQKFCNIDCTQMELGHDIEGDGLSFLSERTFSDILVGAWCTGHVRIMCSAVSTAAPHSHFDVESSASQPHLCMND